MYEAESVRWYTDHGYEISLADLKALLAKHILGGGRIFIGCDSNVITDECVFSCTLCLHGPDESSKTTGFGYRRTISAPKYNDFNLRMFQEAYNALGLALWVVGCFPEAKIQIHIDISSDKKDQRIEFQQSLSKMINDAGFDCKISSDV